MNRGDLWVGNDYAWASYRARGSFPMNAIKVKLLKVERHRESGNENYSTIARVRVVQNGHQSYDKEITARARDIVDFWDEYESEREHRIAERERLEKERRERWEKQKQQQEEEAAKETVARENLAKNLTRKGVPPDAIKSIGVYAITLDRQMIEQWLSSSTTSP